MKKVLLAVLVALGLQTQAQITCDSITTTYLDITPTHIEVTTNSMNLGVQWPMHSWDLYEGCQFGSLTYTDTNATAIIPLPSPNLVDTFVLCNWSDFGAAPWACYSCDTFAWDNGNWSMLRNIGYFCCDSLGYTTYHDQGLNVSLDTTGIIHNPDSIEVWWAVCTNDMCYTGQGMFDHFPQVTTLDTVKVGYDAYLYENGVAEVCSMEEWLVFDGTNWVLLNMNPTSINEITFNTILDNKIYDMLGREVTEVKIGTMYIKNGKKYIKVK